MEIRSNFLLASLFSKQYRSIPIKKRAPKKEATAIPILSALDNLCPGLCGPGETDDVVGGADDGVEGRVVALDNDDGAEVSDVAEALLAGLDVDVELDVRLLEAVSVVKDVAWGIELEKELLAALGVEGDVVSELETVDWVLVVVGDGVEGGVEGDAEDEIASAEDVAAMLETPPTIMPGLPAPSVAANTTSFPVPQHVVFFIPQHHLEDAPLPSQGVKNMFACIDHKSASSSK